jgi:hypothetical protein
MSAFALAKKSFRAAPLRGLLFVIAQKVTKKARRRGRWFCRASCAAKSPALLADAGLLRQYIPILLRNRGDPSPRPFGLFPAPAAMLGTANGAIDP